MTVHSTSIQRSVEIGPISNDPVSNAGIYRFGLKRIFDLAAIMVTLPISLPFMALLSLVISVDGHSPFFRQERIGKDGRRFVMWKFRTMVPDAEKLLDRHLEANEGARKEWDAKQKLHSDPRVTHIGALLRRTSLDELPQLLNVLKGDMSLVGPRPMMPCQQALYPGKSYYMLRPGMTGSWQVSARNTTEFADRAEFDDSYSRRLTFFTDVRILFETVAVVIRGTGV